MWRDVACGLLVVLLQGPNAARRGVDAGDHPPLTPVGLPPYQLSGDQSRVFDLIVRHFLASISRDARYLVTRAVFCAAAPRAGLGAGEGFSCRGKEELDAGFMRVYGRGGHDSEVGALHSLDSLAGESCEPSLHTACMG